MLQPTRLISTPFAQEGEKTEIQNVTGEFDNSATYRLGFPPITMQSIRLGGKPPKGTDFNGVLFDITENISFLCKGGRYQYNAGLSTLIGGYPEGSNLLLDDNVTEVVSTVAGNQNNPNINMTGWILKPNKTTAVNVADASGETQQQVNYNGGSKWHSRVGGYLENERVVLDNGDIVKSTIDGNANDPNVDMTGWANPFEQVSQLLFPFVTLERLGGSTSDSGAKNVLALREYFRGAAAGEYGTLLLGRGRYNLNDSVISTCPVSIKGIGTSVNDTGAYSAFVDNRSTGDAALIKFSQDQAVIGINIDDFEVIGNSRVAAGIEFDIAGWTTQINNIVVRDFKKQGVIFQKTNDGLFSDLRILNCGSKIDDVAYYALDMNPTLTNATGGSNQLNFVRLHIEYSRYFMRMRNWLCNFYGAHFEIGGASKIVNSIDWSTPMFDVGAINYQNNFYGCNFVYPSIYLLYRANSKVGGADFFNTCAPLFGSTLSNIGMQNPVATNVMSFEGCSFIPNGGTGTEVDNTYLYGYKVFNLPFAQVKLSNCSAERLISNNYGGYIVTNRTITLNNNIIHAHVVTQANINNDPANATLLTNFSTAILTKFIRVESNDAAYSSIIGNKFYGFNATQLVEDLSLGAVYSSANFVVANNSGITNKSALPNSIDISKQDFKKSNLLFQLDFSGTVAQKMLADTVQGTFLVERTTDTQNKIQRYISAASAGLYEQNINGNHYTYPVTSGKGGLGLSTNVFKEVHVQYLAVYPPAINIPTTNGEVTFELTSNTQLTVKVKGLDGVVRSAVLTLS